MRLVEAIAAEFQDLVENLLRLVIIHSLGSRTLHEFWMEFRYDIRGLFADSLDQLICGRQLDPAELIKNLHHLFLVDHNSVSFLQDFIHDRMHLRDLLAPELAAAIQRNQLHRSGAEERVGGDQVFDAVRPHFHEQVLHSAGFKLEYSPCFAAAEQSQDVLIGEVDLFDVNFNPLRLFHQLNRARERRQRPQTQKIHLQQPALLDNWPFILRENVITHLIKWHEILQRLIGDHHAGRVTAGVATSSLQPLGHVDHLLNLRIVLIKRGQLRALL